MEGFAPRSKSSVRIMRADTDKSIDRAGVRCKVQKRVPEASVKYHRVCNTTPSRRPSALATTARRGASVVPCMRLYHEAQ